ncbi:hypothetical protein SAMN06297468_0057 [Altererythrobacter xiamenensis]|uniref:Lipopolysaccharide assembly protein A domain-containing protein n=1 Tax=Altererythrobacter xiamenensis TaxID=1316679 RepID=A0A1Y6E586_9SPHN|nr:hypothetical protein [Altererythrobacter xiamenensis]SMQ57809.1 hypothetical protein SAMN06297468_0057 [Altererythrobacter xiamenensis]
MQVVRTIVWLLILVGVLLFSWANWDERVTVNIWNNLVWDTRLPAVVIVSFLLGHLPMWLYYRGVKWNLGRRITSLENAARSSALSRHAPTPSASSDATPTPTPASTATAAPISDPAAADDTLTPTKDNNP